MLALDSSTRAGSVAIGGKDGMIDEINFSATRSHSSGLMPTIDKLLRKHKVVCPTARVEDSGLSGLAGVAGDFPRSRPGFGPSGSLAGLAFTLGPGSFTGLRVALATVKGLAVGWELPLVPFNTLEVMANGLAALDGTLVPLIDARKGEVFGAVYRSEKGKIVEIEPPFLKSPARLAEDLQSYQGTLHLFGGGALLYGDLLSGQIRRARVIHGLPGIHRPRARVMARLAWDREPLAKDEVGRLNPFYIRPSDVEFPKKEAS